MTVKEFQEWLDKEGITIEVEGNPRDGWVAWVVENEGCITQANKLDELFCNVKEAWGLYKETAFARGKLIMRRHILPLPGVEETDFYVFYCDERTSVAVGIEAKVFWPHVPSVKGYYLHLGTQNPVLVPCATLRDMQRIANEAWDSELKEFVLPPSISPLTLYTDALAEKRKLEWEAVKQQLEKQNIKIAEADDE